MWQRASSRAHLTRGTRNSLTRTDSPSESVAAAYALSSPLWHPRRSRTAIPSPPPLLPQGLSEANAISTGRIFQGLLECLREAGAEHAQLDNSAKKQNGGMGVARQCGLDANAWDALAQRADALRKLVRIKVRGAHAQSACHALPTSLPRRERRPSAPPPAQAYPDVHQVADDNDLKTAKAGLVLCHEFFDGLAQLASLEPDSDGGRQKDEFEIFQTLVLTC